jgi:hypothetical protein
LAKYDPPPRSLLARHYLRLASRYDLVVLLDAPPAVLAERDGEHCREELEQWRLLYRRWIGRAEANGTQVLVVDTASRQPGAIVSHVVRAVRP